MIHYKKFLYIIFTFLTLHTYIQPQEEIPNEFKGQTASATVQHQHAKKIAALEASTSNSSNNIDNLNNSVKALQTSNTTLYTMLLTGEIDKLIIFNSDVVLLSNNLDVIELDQLAVFAPENNKAEIQADSFTGITSSSYDNLTLTPNAPSNQIQTHTIVNGVLSLSNDLTINGNLVVNGGLIVDSGITLQVNGDILLDGQCAYTFINNGTITSTGNITIQNYFNTIDDAVTNNTGATISSTGTISNKNNILFKNNISTNGTAIINTGTNATITTAGNIIFENNAGSDQAVYNTLGARIHTTSNGFISFNNNYSASGTAICNNGSSASIDTVNGDIFVKGNQGNIGALANMDSAIITSTNNGSIYINNNISKSMIAILNTGTSSSIQTTVGDIFIENNKGTTTAVSNMANATINVLTMGSIWIKNNLSTGAYGIYNVDGATIESNAAGCIVFEKNSGNTVGIKNENNAEINAIDYILFNGNKGRTESGVHNDRGLIQATSPQAFIKFSHNIGRNYGVLNNATAAGTSEIRTTNATTFPSNQTKILYIGNSGGIQDTYNSNGSGTANIIAGATSPSIIGNGLICYDSQKNLNVVSGTVSPEPRICAKDEYLETPIIESLNVNESVNKTIVFDRNVNVTLDALGALSLGGITNGLTVLAHLTDPATIQVKSTATDIQQSSFSNLILTTGTTSNEITGSVVLSNGNLTVNDDIIINGDLTIKGGSLVVATGTTLTINGDLIANGLDQDKQIQINGTGSIIAENITIQNYAATSGSALTVSGTLTSQCGIINIHDMTSNAADSISITGTITADNTISFKKNSSTATGNDGVHISGSGSIISSGGHVQFIQNIGQDAGNGVLLSGQSIIKSLNDILIKENRSDGIGIGDGTGSAFNITDTAQILGSHIIFKDNESGGREITIATGAIVSGCQSILFDQKLTASSITVTDDISGTLLGNVTICDDLNIDGDLTITGSLTVLGGSVTIANAQTLTVTGDIIFDGQNKVDKTVSIIGNIYGTTSSDSGAKTLTIKNYNANNSGTAISITGNITITHDITILSNQTNTVSSSCIDMSGANCALKSLVGTLFFINNQSKNSSGGNAIHIQNDVISNNINANNIIFIHNTSCNTNQQAILIEQSMTALHDIKFEYNQTISGNNLIYGVELGSTTQTCTNTFIIHKTSTDHNQEAKFDTVTFTDPYGAPSVIKHVIDTTFAPHSC